MEKIYYVVENHDDYAQVNFFKTEKEALAHGISEFPDFDMFDEPMEDEEDGGWFTGDQLDIKKGILFQMKDGDWSIESMDEAAAREEVEGKENSGAIYFDDFKKGAYGYLGNGADGKHYKWDWDGSEFHDINQPFYETRYK